jgi:hypothetical protein
LQGFRLFLIALAVWFAAATTLAASDVLLDPRAETAVRVEVPHLLTRAVAVTNAGTIPREFREDLLLPKGWHSVTADSDFSLASQARELRLLCIAIPADAPPGFYSLYYAVRDRGSGLVLADTVIAVEVLPVLKIEIAVRDAPRRVLAAEGFAVRFEIWSSGNVPCTVSVHVQTSAGVPVRLSEDRIALEPGERRILTAYAKSERNLRQAQPQWLTLRAEAVEGEVRSAAQTTIAVNALPQPSRGDDLYRRVPSHAALRYVGSEDQNGLQLELGGNGTLDARGDQRVEYLIRGPRDLERHLYGLRDEYYLSLRNPLGEVRAGDLLFSLSRLTEQNRLGRGAKAAYHSGLFAVGAYNFTSRAKYPDLSETAAFFSITPRAPVQLQLNFLDKSTAEARRGLLTFSGSTSLLRHTNIEAEIGAGQNLKHVDATAAAVWGRVERDLPLNARLSAEKALASPGFPGYYSNQDHNAVALYLPLSAKARWQASYRYAAQNLDRDAGFSTALREHELLSTVSYALPFRAQLNLDMADMSHRDALEPADFDYGERFATLRVRQPIHRLTLNGLLRQGVWRDRRAGDSGPSERYGASVSLSPDSRQNYAASFQTGHSGPQAVQNRIFGLSATCRVIPGLLLAANWQKANYRSYLIYENDQLSLDVRYTFYRRHTLSFRYRRLEYEQNYLSRGTAWMISYELPVGMPVGRQDKFGSVKGRISDAEDSLRAGLAGVLLTLDGRAALSDRKGNYIFPSVEPGVHYLQVERSSIGLNRITMQRAPLEVRVRGGHSELLDLAVVRGAVLSGEVALFGSGAGSVRGVFVASDSAASGPDSLTFLYNLPGAELELRSDQEVRRALTDRNGRFTFDELVPGHWVLALLPSTLPAFHDPESQSYELTVEPASHTALTLRVVPHKRSVIIVDEGKVPVISTRK